MSTATALTFDLPLNLGAGLNNRGHWSAASRRAKQERELTHWVTASELRRSGFVLTRQMTVTMTRISAGTLDDDNLQGACKHVRDGIADAFGVPDNDPRIVWRCEQEKCRRGQHGVRVDIALACASCGGSGRVLIARLIDGDGLVTSERYGPCRRNRAGSSMAEREPHKLGNDGSTPSRPTKRNDRAEAHKEEA